MSILIFIIVLYHKKAHLTYHILIGLTIGGALHIFGGNIYLGTTRLYDYWLIPHYFKYDNLVHTFNTFVATFVIYSLLKPHLDKKLDHNSFLLGLLLVLITMGLGAFNEILEFGAVIFLGAAKQVGNYFNNALDLVFNLIGSSLAVIRIIIYHKRLYKKENKLK